MAGMVPVIFVSVSVSPPQIVAAVPERILRVNSGKSAILATNR